MRRIVVVGTSGSGKTALARRLAGRLSCPYIELDALHWRPNWTEAPVEEFRERVRRAVDGDAWVVDGNYGVVRDIVWPRADTLVWLDYPLGVILWRLLRRSVQRLMTRQELWAGNREDLRLLLSRDSIFLWALRTYRTHRRAYGAVAHDPAKAHLAMVRLRSPRAGAAWLTRLDRH